MPNDDLTRRMQQFSQRLDWNLLKTFYDIVEANGITAAANVGWQKQSTISLALKRLEAFVGSRLCQRGRAGFELTDEGRILYDCVKHIHEGIEQSQYAIDNSRYNISGKLDVAIISNFASNVMDGIFIKYNSEYPDVLINLDVLTWSDITKCVVNNDYDIGISPILYRHSDLRYDFLVREYHSIYCGRQHHLFNELPDPITLSDEAFILTGSDEPDSFTSFRLRHRLGQKVTARTPNLEEARRLTVAGVGVCILPEQFVAADVDDGLLWPLLGRTEDLSCDIYLISNIHSQKRTARDAFIEKFVEVTNDIIQ
ncbi:LysR family transcriptional regulator [Aminobacter sp. NyZ550]|uniref:LysR family transcriptional regulator n=1 Tax=Aminobacter sp. NyZ550 TaxID=2979870 RepID=UPI0021D5B869|nr:LysR family transcriptional regulator [Aminobacter sp. NyZ550]WAX96906.1 LysR family transcriptional regulator [Aminobacter sp. NyZ550]